MTEHHVHHGALSMAALLFAVGLFAWSCDPAEAQEPIPSIETLGGPFSADEVALARLVTNEASLPSRTAPTQDGIVIGDIIVRLAADRGLSVAEYIAAVHHRHSRTDRTNRPWIAELDGSMHQPPSWPADAGPWSTAVYRWRYRLLEARAVLSGQLRPACSGAITWGGRVDRERIDRMTSSGRYRIVECGAVRNTYLARVR